MEVLGALRRLTSHRDLGSDRAAKAVRDLHDLDLVRYPHLPLADAIWAYRSVLTAADATFVALARALGAPLLTTDERLSRAPHLPIAIIAP